MARGVEGSGYVASAYNFRWPTPGSRLQNHGAFPITLRPRTTAPPGVDGAFSIKLDEGDSPETVTLAFGDVAHFRTTESGLELHHVDRANLRRN